MSSKGSRSPGIFNVYVQLINSVVAVNVIYSFLEFSVLWSKIHLYFR